MAHEGRGAISQTQLDNWLDHLITGSSHECARQVAVDFARQRVHEAVATQLRDAILDGRFQAGDKHPQRELAEEFGVNRTSIREAIKILEGLRRSSCVRATALPLAHSSKVRST
jgi:hypothetical protein